METSTKQKIDAQRDSLVRRSEGTLARPLAVLGFVWLLLIIVELTRGLSPFLTRVGLAIWAIFLVDFVFKFALAPSKRRYLRRNGLTLLSLAVPALRLVRVLSILRIARAARGLNLLRLLASWNRGMRALAQSMRRRGFGYVMLLTLLVLASGAAGIYAFERGAAPGGLDDYGTALWWTAMILTTMGSDYWPQTPEGRFLCLLLAVYGFAMFGYVTATLATFFVARDAAALDSERAPAALLQAETARRREESRRGGEPTKPA